MICKLKVISFFSFSSPPLPLLMADRIDTTMIIRTVRKACLKRQLAQSTQFQTILQFTFHQTTRKEKASLLLDLELNPSPT